MKEEKETYYENDESKEAEKRAETQAELLREIKGIVAKQYNAYVLQEGNALAISTYTLDDYVILVEEYGKESAKEFEEYVTGKTKEKSLLCRLMDILQNKYTVNFTSNGKGLLLKLNCEQIFTILVRSVEFAKKV